MKYSIGYQMRKDDDFLECIIRNKEKIHEVYFSWGDFANGRNSQLQQKQWTAWEAQAKQEMDLIRLARAGISFNLLFNATCYGKDSQARMFYRKVGETVEYLQEEIGIASITTTSPLIARFIKDNFEGIDVRASVNMSIGTIEGMDYVSDCFDSYYMAREQNRNFNKIAELKQWCDHHNKTLYGLANSGCLNYCSAHVFHDNLVSHESEIAGMDNGYVFEGICRKYLKKKENEYALLENTSYIRPEDIYLYDDFFPAVKLATRVSPYPVMILKAYIEKQGFSGNVLDLLEPNHSGSLYPRILENKKINSQVRNGHLSYSNLDDALIMLEN